MSDPLNLSELKADAESDEIASTPEEERLKRVKELQANIGELESLIPKRRPEPARSVPSNKLGARKHASFKAVSTAPSINLTPRGRTMVPVAYPTVQDLSGSVSVASGVRFNNCAVYLLDRSTQPKCTGDQAGTGGGVRSGTVNGVVKPVDGCKSVRVEGKRVVREGDACTMNAGNNPGVYLTVPVPNSAPPSSAILISNPPIQLDSMGSPGASDANNPLDRSYPRADAEIVAAKFQHESLDGSGPLRRDLAMLQKPTGPSFVARDIATETESEKARQYTRNSLTTALLGPVFGMPGAATRVLGGSESNVALGNEVGAAAMGMAWSMGGVPGRQVVRVEPKIVVVSRSAVAEARPAGGGVKVIGQSNTLIVDRGVVTYAHNSVENPGPLALLSGNPASNFISGKYNLVVLAEDVILYRGGEVGKPLGQWFTRETPKSVAEIRIDSAVKSQWIDPATGHITGRSPIDTVFAIKIPKGTTVYEGPVGYQGGVHLGGPKQNQIFVEAPWKIKGVEVISEKTIK